MKTFYSYRTWFYSNVTTVLICLILFTVVSKLGVSYFDNSQKFIIPERQFAASSLGRDIYAYTILPVYEIRKGNVPFIFGYGSVTMADIILRPLESIHICSSASPVSCKHVLYVLLIASSVIGFLGYIFFIAKDEGTRLQMLLVYCLFLLGVPYAKAIEAGNLDLILAVIYGTCMYLCVTYNGKTMKRSLSILLGILLGLLLSTKAFFVLFVSIALLFRFKDLYTIGSFMITFAFSSLWPRIYGVPAGIFDVFSFAMRGSDAFGPQLYTQVNYGNNALVSYVSNMLQLIDTGNVSLPLHIALTQILSLFIGWVVCIRPLFVEGAVHLISKAIQKNDIVHRLGFFTKEFSIVLFTFATVGMIVLPAWSYDYRLLYLLPVLFTLQKYSVDSRSKLLLYTAIVLITLKSVWIPKDRLLNIFLYIHIFVLQRAAISVWINSRIQSPSTQ